MRTSHRETVGFRIIEERGEDGAPPGNRRFAYYIDVPYGQRELLILAPDGNLLAFGQSLEGTLPAPE